MVSELAIPVMDQTTETVTLAGWLKREGDAVRQGEAVCEIETAKAMVELPAPADGVLRRVLIQAGAEIPPRTVVGLIAADGEALPEIDPFYLVERAAVPAKAEAPSQPAPAASEPARKLVVSPRARRLAEQHNLDLAGIEGTGPAGRILEEDVQAALERAAQPAPSAPSAAARVKAERVSASWQGIPHFYTSLTIDLHHVAARRAAAGAGLTYTDFFAQALGRALPHHSELNGFWRAGGPEPAAEVRLGLVVETEQGLVIAALSDVRGRELESIAEERARLVAQARAGRLPPDALAGATFTLSNVGPGHIDAFTAIISPPQVAILSVGSVQMQPRAVGEAVVVRLAATFTLGADHRAVDGRQAARFLERLKAELEAEA
jgi:pyruvate dehydrogenase E2 component (dihydrolipoamide acetyltransferase)